LTWISLASSRGMLEVQLERDRRRDGPSWLTSSLPFSVFSHLPPAPVVILNTPDPPVPTVPYIPSLRFHPAPPSPALGFPFPYRLPVSRPILSQTPRRYTEDHEWTSYEPSTNIATIGVTDYAQKALGDVVFVELPEVGNVVEKGGTSFFPCDFECRIGGGAWRALEITYTRQESGEGRGMSCSRLASTNRS
jgi:hypothetical protein